MVIVNEELVGLDLSVANHLNLFLNVGSHFIQKQDKRLAWFSLTISSCAYMFEARQ